MKKKKSTEEMRFEVVIPPTDVLEQELQEVLGGLAEAECFTCNKRFKCKEFTINSLPKGKNDADCPAGSVLIGEHCVPEEWAD